MKRFSISAPDQAIRENLINKINCLTKPKGSLGMLEEMALQIGLIQQSLSPELHNPCNVLFAADHGIIEEGVSVSPKEVTWQQLGHFSKGGAGINFLCNQHGFRLLLVDAGVDYDVPENHGIINRKIRKSTRNFLHEAAMTAEEYSLALQYGSEIVDKVYQEGCNIISFGEMGSGNTSSASLWMHIFTGIDLKDCIGAGAGLDNPGIKHKSDVLHAALENYHGEDSKEAKMAWFGGYELVMATGAMLRAAELKMTVIIDGFLMTACAAAAAHFHPAFLQYALFGHQGDEAGHKLLIKALGARPILHLGMRLGEGSGAVCAYPIIESAVRMINEMDSFADVEVTKYFD